MLKKILILEICCFILLLTIGFFDQIIQSENKSDEYYYKSLDKYSTDIKLENMDERIVDSIDFDYTNLDLSDEELRVVKKYQEASQSLKIGNYDWISKGEWYYSSGSVCRIGLNEITIKIIENVFKINVENNSMSYDEAIEEVTNGKVDLLLGLNYSNILKKEGLSHSEKVSNSKIYMYSVERLILEKYEDWEGLRIGVTKSGSIFSKERVGELLENRVEIEVVEFDDYSQIYDAMDKGEIDCTPQYISYNALERGFNITDISRFYPYKNEVILYSTKNPDIEILVGAFEKMYNYSGLVQIALNDYTDKYALFNFENGSFFTNEEMKYIESTHNDPLKIFCFEKIPPFVYYDCEIEDYRGSFVEIWDLVASISNVEYEFISSIDGVETGNLDDSNIENNGESEIDGFIALIVDEVNRKKLLYTKPIHSYNRYLIGRIGADNIYEITDLMDKSVSLLENAYPSKYLKEMLPEKEFNNEYSTVTASVDSFLSGETDYVIMLKEQFYYYYYILKKYDIEMKYKLDVREDGAISFYDRDSNENMVSIYNKIIPFINKEEIKDHYSNIQVDMNKIIEMEERMKVYTFVSIILLILIGATSILIISKNDKVKMNKINKKLKMNNKMVNETKNDIEFILDNLYLGVLLISKDLEILKINKRCISLLDFDSKIAVEGESLFCEHIYNMGYFKRSDFKLSPKEKTISKVSRTSKALEIRIKPVLDANNEITNIVITVKDVADEVIKKHQLESDIQMEMIGEIAGGITHDFNNILQVIVGYCELVNSELNLSNSNMLAKRKLDDISIEIKEAEKMLKELLVFTKDQQLVKKEIDANLAIRQLAPMLEVLLEDVELNLICDEKVRIIEIDKNEFNQMLINICNNSRDAIESQGRVDIEVSEDYFFDEKFATITICDNGHGIDLDIIDQVFSAFFTTKEASGSLGLGLFSTRDMIKKNRGYIEIDEYYTDGTRIVIYLPMIG